MLIISVTHRKQHLFTWPLAFNVIIVDLCYVHLFEPNKHVGSKVTATFTTLIIRFAHIWICSSLRRILSHSICTSTYEQFILLYTHWLFADTDKRPWPQYRSVQRRSRSEDGYHVMYQRHAQIRRWSGKLSLASFSSNIQRVSSWIREIWKKKLHNIWCYYQIYQPDRSAELTTWGLLISETYHYPSSEVLHEESDLKLSAFHGTSFLSIPSLIRPARETAHWSSSISDFKLKIACKISHRPSKISPLFSPVFLYL